MRALIMETGAHIDPVAVRRDCPAIAFDDARDHAGALALASEQEILVALAHEVSDELLARLPRLRYICSLTSGVEHLKGLERLPPDVIVTNGRGIHGPQMAELAILYMISLSRGFPAMLDNQRAGLWQRWPQKLVFSKTIAIIGLGAIADDLALRCKAFGSSVIGVSDARTAAANFDAVYPRAAMKEALAMADFVVLLVPLDARTHHLIDGAALDAMKPGAILVNIARGPVVDTAALTERLRAGRLGGAGLDVFEEEPLPAHHPLRTMPNVIVTPRIGGMSDVYAQQVHPLVVHNLTCFAAGRHAEMRNRC